MCPALYGARLSQAYTTTDKSITLQSDEIIEIPDITRNGSVFTDGVGTMSLEAAANIASALNRPRKSGYIRPPTFVPDAYQIRQGGNKGMLSVDTRLSGRVICVRPSMNKFDALELRDLEIARAFRSPGRMYLNRPLIMLLDTLGIPHNVFLDLQNTIVVSVRDSTKSLSTSAKTLEDHGLGTAFRLPSVLRSLRRCGIELAPAGAMTDDFLECSLNYAVQHVLRELKYHARIPVDNSWNLVGVADVYDYLEEGEIFGECPGSSPPVTH